MPFKGAFVDVRRGFGLFERAIVVLKGQLAPSRPFSMGMPVASG